MTRSVWIGSVKGRITTLKRHQYDSYKLQKKNLRIDVAKYSFGNRVINEWNRLPDRILQGDNLNKFKGELDKYLGHTRGLR